MGRKRRCFGLSEPKRGESVVGGVEVDLVGVVEVGEGFEFAGPEGCVAASEGSVGVGSGDDTEVGVVMAEYRAREREPELPPHLKKYDPEAWCCERRFEAARAYWLRAHDGAYFGRTPSGKARELPFLQAGVGRGPWPLGRCGHEVERSNDD